jgi:hypothetical protein
MSFRSLAVFRPLLIGACLLIILSPLRAQTIDTTGGPGWKVGIETSLGLTQAAFSDNWTGGESGSIIWVSNFRGTASKNLGASLFWANEMRLEFGQTHSQTDSTKHWERPKKSTDKIRHDAILRLMRGWPVDPFASGTIESQFVSRDSLGHKIYVNPVDLTEAVGVARDIYNIPDKSVLTTRVGVGLRQHMMHAVKTTNYGGVEWVTDFTLGAPSARYNFVSKFTVFQAFANSQKDELPNDYWKTADLNWDNTLRANLTTILQMSLNWQLLYDKEIDLGGRFRETLSLGLAYKFANYEEKK